MGDRTHQRGENAASGVPAESATGIASEAGGLTEGRDEARLAELKGGYAYEALLWQFRLRSHPTGTIPVGWREKALSSMDVQRMAAAKTGAGEATTLSALNWQSIGPDQVGGRVRSVAIDPNNSNIIYCGAVAGGVWKSTNAGADWFPTGDQAATLVIGCIAIDPTNSNIIYAGTGEGYFNYDGLRGAGILKSTDAGASWVLLTTMNGSPAGFPYYINDIYFPNSGVGTLLFAATNSGLFRSTNSGAGWSYILRGTNTFRCTQIVGDPSNPGVFYVAFGNLSTEGIYKTTNGGTNFTKLTGGFPTTGFQRIGLAISKSNPSVLYAALADATTYQTHSIQKTTDGGASWTAVTTPTDSDFGTHLGGQGWYNNVMAVDPADPSIVYAGGVNAFKSTNAGSTWSRISNGFSSASLHFDQHAIVFDPSNPSLIYFGNDGGMYRSTNGGTSFSKINSGLRITQFYSGAADPSADIYYGGTQDNGTLKSGSPDWTESLGGDGGVTAVDVSNPTTVYTEYTYLDFQRSFNSGGSWSKSMNGIPNAPGEDKGTTDRCAFIAPYVLDPSNPQTIVAGTYRVFRTTNGATTWSAISGDLTGDGDGAGQVGSLRAVISALGIAKTSSATIYAGTTGYVDNVDTTLARIWVTTNTGSSWSDVTKTSLPNRAITSIAIDPGDASRAYLAFSGYNANTPTRPGHLWRTTNRGVSWSNVSGNLPDIPVNVVILDTLKPTLHIIVGTDLGVFETSNGGTSWTEENTGMARVSVFDLDLRPDGVLLAATHGRGMFRTPGSVITAVSEPVAEVPLRHALAQNYPNPFNPVTTIAFDVAAQSEVSLRVFDAAGREVETLFRGERGPGSYTTRFDGSSRASGVYFYTLEIRTAGGAVSTETKKMLLVK